MENVFSTTLVGKNLKTLRVANKYTQEEIADYLNVDQSLISKIEHGERNINMTMIEKLTLLYNIHDYELMEPLEDYKPLKVKHTGVKDLNAIAKMNQVRGYLRLLRRL